MKENSKKKLESTLEIPKLGSSKKAGPSPNNPQDPSSKNKKKTHSPHYKARIFAGILGTITAIGVLGVLVVSIFVVSAVNESPEVSVDMFENLDSTVILDANGDVFYDTGAKLVENITYEDIPNSLIDAFLSIEDSRFYEHNGFDLPRFSIAMLNNVKDSVLSMRLSFSGGGASTIDMQLVRNGVFSKEDPVTGEVVTPADSGPDGIKRKIQEIYIATSLNNNNILSKRSIFQMYVNKINFGTGNNILGVEKSANFYFDKSVSELNLVESAFLAGVINSPSNNTPYASLETATDRTHTVIDMMLHHGYISEEEHARAMTVPLENLFVDRSGENQTLDYQAYVDLVLAEAEEITGKSPVTTPMVIHTAMNINVQTAMDQVSRREVSNLNFGSRTDLQMASSIVDNSTGEVIAVMGGYDYNNKRSWLRVKETHSQPGSTIKPLVDYAPAFEYLGWATSHVMMDQPYVWGGTDFAVGNWDGRFEGQVTLRRAISDSRNIPAIEAFTAVYDSIGRQRYIEYLRSFGFNIFEEDGFDHQFSIGGNRFETSPYELAGAYAAIFNGGVFTEPHTIRQVDFKDGSESVMSPYASNQVISEAAAFMTAQTMRYVILDNLTYTARPTRRSYPVYGKTGTTNHDQANANNFGVPANSAKDLWIVNATDRFTFATWSGFDKFDKDAWLTTEIQRFNLPGNMNSYILDVLAEEYGVGREISRPSTVSDITHILGTFPYQSPIDGMDSSLITTGLIKRDRLNLVEATPPTLNDLASATITTSGGLLNTKITVNMTPYPNADALTVAPTTFEMTSSTGRTFTGKRLYDPSWIFGAVRYQADLYVNGELQKTVMSDTENVELTLSNFTSGEVRVCAYYTFEKNQDKRSNEICNTLDMSNSEVEVPDFETEDDVTGFSNQYGKDVVSLTYQPVSDINRYNTVASVSPDYRGQKVTLSKLKSSKMTVVINDFVIDVMNYTNRPYSEFANQFGGYFTLKKEGSGNNIVSISGPNETPLTSIRLSSMEGQTLTIKTQ
ncbi:hypothetical protein AOC36_04270 [Erysipelothrix larvae]|uniref:Uncharacterized protein n=1 Tax=Erysipelothrix larvae TaxID=1514105 RepID=A0A109UGV8_9FIRM|nr:transglycosylase domain-containing protein [Erysipelothrix larvae]AMC93213.1 hypothetical protein AOC36_04270 [Erysipelothrix larvae]